MVLTSVDNDELLMNGTEQNLFSSQVALKHYQTNVFFDELVGGDEILVRVYIEDKFAALEKRYRTEIVRGLQDNPARLANWLPTGSYRVTAQQIAGVNKTITWELLFV